MSWLLVHCSFSPVCQQSSSGSDSDEDQDMQAESESESDAPPSSDELPNEDDVKFWETPSGHDIYLSTPLSPATETTRGDALVMCLALGLRHKLAWTVIVDILRMINRLFGQDVIKATKYFFLKYMEAGKGIVTYHMYCHYCHNYLGARGELDGDVEVCRCGKSVKDKKAKKSFFITLSLEEQLRDLLKDKTFVDAIHYRFTRKRHREDSYEDIYDGDLYSKLSGPGGILSQWYNLSYTFNTDGFPVGGKSGKQTCWPIYVQINELPPKMRSKFMLLAGVYVGRHDPNMQLYLHPFVQEANFLSTQGINWIFNNKKINTKVIPLAACVDTPARSKILNMTLFSGAYGCTICPNNPESFFKIGVRYTLPLNAVDERTHDGIVMDAAKAHANKTLIRNKKNRKVRGVKGPSPLQNLMYFDLVKGVRPDIMHSILLGNGKHHLTILNESPGKLYYIGADVTMGAINNRLMTIRPPTSLPRMPRDFFSYASWKANEWLVWILFFAVPCLLELLPIEYVAHLNMLTSVLHIFLKKSISPEELNAAHIVALRYVFLFQQYFGREQMVINVHLLMHMKNSIKYLGPSWTNMAFGFEGANKRMLEMKKGTSSVAQEMVSKYLSFRALPLLCDKFASSRETLKFCEKLSGRPLLKSVLRVENIVLVGKGKRTTLSDEENACLLTKVSAPQKPVLTYDKFFMDGVRFATAAHCQAAAKDDSFVSVSGESRAIIQKILCLEGSGHPTYLLVRELVLSETPLFDDEFGRLSPLQKVINTGKLYAIKPGDITGQCVAMFLESGNFVCQVPFGCYGDS